MIIDCNYKDKNKGFSKFEKGTLNDLIVELNNIQNPLSKFETFEIECKLTDILKKFLDSCNKNLLSSFKLDLTMVDDKEDAY
jgi:hypothetical protein